MVSSFRDLLVWQKSFDLVTKVYELTERLPKNEVYGLYSQTRRSTVSTPSNIAEGQQRNNRKEFRQFLRVAKDSSAELDAQLLLITKLYNVDTNELLSDLHGIQKMLQAIISKLFTPNSNLYTGVK